MTLLSNPTPQSGSTIESLLTPARDFLSTEREPGQRLQFLAHQGAQGEYPSNSLAAIERSLGVADCVELDVYTTERSDGGLEVVVIHPEGYFLYVNPQGMQNEKPLPLSYEETRELKSRGVPLIPTINEVLDSYVHLCQQRGKRSELHIELKGPGTAEALLPILHERISTGQLSYDDFILTSLSYPGDRSRLEGARRLDPNVRLAFVARGGDFKVDGFDGLNDAISFAKDIQADTFIVSRRLLSPTIVQEIRDAGFRVGCFHCRTSDEAEAAISLDADFVAADLFVGASILSYPGAREKGSPLFKPLSSLEFYKFRDWIWELGWEMEKVVKTETGSPRTQRLIENAGDGGVFIDQAGNIFLEQCTKGISNGTMVDFSARTIGQAYLGKIDNEVMQSLNRISNWKEFISLNYQESLFNALATKLRIQASPEAARNEYFSMDFIVAISEGQNVTTSLPPEELRTLSELSREVLVRYGRALGTLAFTALNPRHGDRDQYTAKVLLEGFPSSEWIKLGCEQQIEAQGLRSGKLCVTNLRIV